MVYNGYVILIAITYQQLIVAKTMDDAELLGESDKQEK
jgi:hypothetical protein